MNLEEKIKALSRQLELNFCKIKDKIQVYDEEQYFIYGNAAYLVLTEEEADAKWEDTLNSYIEECILPELPEHFINYFDEEKWKRDARCDGRGHALARYDGNEYEQQVDGVWYYIYRTD